MIPQPYAKQVVLEVTWADGTKSKGVLVGEAIKISFDPDPGGMEWRAEVFPTPATPVLTITDIEEAGTE